jgi:Fic family protein
MDITRFTSNLTGKLVPVVTDDGQDHGFIPAPLPPQWEFPARLYPLLIEARQQLARLDEKGKNMQNPSLLLQPLQKSEALRSSSLEGTYATAKELLLFELAPREPSSRADKVNDWREVANYDAALRHGVRRLNDETQSGLPISKRLIQEMHKILMEGVRGDDGTAGEWRTKHVYVGSGQRYVAPPPGAVLAECLDSLDRYMGGLDDSVDPLVRSYLIHYQFEAIHPFRDGNGRIGRLLLALTTYKLLDLYLPWLYMSAYFERFKDEYVDNMFRISTHGDWERWIEFCLRGTIAQCKDAIRKCTALYNLKERMHGEMSKRPRMKALIDRMFFSPMFTSIQVAEWGDVSLPTARRDVEELESAGWVEHLDGERPKTYYVPMIFVIAYQEGQPKG